MSLFCTIVNLPEVNLCNNALNLAIGQLIVDSTNWPRKTYCQWLILAQEDDSYVTIEVSALILHDFHFHEKLM